MVSNTSKQRLLDLDCSSGALRSNIEGNLPGYVAAVLRGGDYLGKPLEITGYFLEVPQKTVMKKLEDVVVTDEVTKLGTIQILQLAGVIRDSNYALRKKDKYRWQNKRSPHETKFTKVVKIKSRSKPVREFYTDAKIPFLDWE
jgi:hypothetical protein